MRPLVGDRTSPARRMTRGAGPLPLCGTSRTLATPTTPTLSLAFHPRFPGTAALSPLPDAPIAHSDTPKGCFWSPFRLCFLGRARYAARGLRPFPYLAPYHSPLCFVLSALGLARGLLVSALLRVLAPRLHSALIILRFAPFSRASCRSLRSRTMRLPG